MRKFVLLLLFGAAFAKTLVVNDSDWRCVFLVGYYAELSGNRFYAITPSHEVVPGDAYVITCGKPYVGRYDRVYNGYLDLMLSLPVELGIGCPAVAVPEDPLIALMAAPYAFRRKARIYFITPESIEDINKVGCDKILVEYSGKTIHGRRISVEDLLEKNSALLMSGRFLYLPANPGDPLFWTGFRGKRDVIFPWIDYNGSVLIIGPELMGVREEYGGKVYSFIADVRSGRVLPPPRIALPTETSKVFVESASVSGEGNFSIKFRNQGLPNYVRIVHLVFDCGRREIVDGNISFRISDVYFLTGNISSVSNECTMNLRYVYGPTEHSLINVGKRKGTVPVLGFEDVNLNIHDAVYGNGVVYVDVLNRENEGIFVHATLVLNVDGEPYDVSSREVEIPPKAHGRLFFPVYFRDSDLVDDVNIILRAGKDPNGLFTVKRVKIHVRKQNIIDILLENKVLILALIFVLVFLYVRRSA